MHWLYHLTKTQPSEGAVAQEVYLRAVKPGMEQAEERQVSQIIQLYVFAMDFYFSLADNPLDTEEGRHIYEHELSEKNYFIQSIDLEPQHDHLMQSASLYLKTDRFDEQELREWLKVYLAVSGYECTDFEETDLGSFPEMNPILSLFSLENVKKFEDKFGKDWWKKNDKPGSEPDTPND
jgi:hypothetical protein